MTEEEHMKRHEELHQMLDELIVDFIQHTGKLPSSTTIYELMVWSHKQTKNPDDYREESE